MLFGERAYSLLRQIGWEKISVLLFRNGDVYIGCNKIQEKGCEYLSKL